MPKRVFESPSGEARQHAAAAWLAERARGSATIVAASHAAASAVARRALGGPGATLGWRRFSLPLVAATIARGPLLARGRVPASPLALQAVCARLVHDDDIDLGRLAPLRGRPGLPRAVHRTIHELRMARASHPDLASLLRAYERALDALGLCDPAEVYEEAAARVRDGAVGFDLGSLLFYDARAPSAAERDLVLALAGRADDAFATVPTGDERTRAAWVAALGVEPEAALPGGDDALARLQRGLFARAEGDLPGELAAGDASVRILSAPGESREAVEIARLVHAATRDGTPLDKIAVLVRTRAYGPFVQEALRRARVPAFFASGARRPDPSGRAFLALLTCAAEGLRATRFAEYLSLGELPDETNDGAPPEATPRDAAYVPPDEEIADALLSVAARDVDDDEPAPPEPVDEDRAVVAGSLRAPRHWERLLVDAAVIGGVDRWERRIRGLRETLRADHETYARKEETHLAEATARDLALTGALERFALPLVRDLAALPAKATWGAWVSALTDLASRALRDPTRVTALLADLAPMAPVTEVTLREVLLVLEPRLGELAPRTAEPRGGRVFVGTVDEARGLVFDVVFVPGLAEKSFPLKISEDPLLLDRARASADAGLETNAERARDERLALRVAVGAARKQVVLSYPRLDVERARPRTPSFYGLEVLRVIEGALPGFEELARRADRSVNARVGWPAPERPEDAIDEAEHDLALLERYLPRDAEPEVGAAHYLLDVNEHLARALRFRGRRWTRRWNQADGLVDPPEEARAALARHALDARSFSPTALQHFAACPYRFLLSALHRLAVREVPDHLETLDPLTRGSMMHEIMYELLTELRDRGALPVTPENLDAARDVLDAVCARVQERFKDTLAPAIERVWDDAMTAIAGDLREWLRKMSLEPEWIPTHFELSFGLRDRRAEDPHSTDEPARLPIGVLLRGSIDLVERDGTGALRATDYKTGKKRADKDTVIGGGEILQPVLYALTLEALFPGARVVGGRLYYCTATGGFEAVDIPLDAVARDSAALVASTVRRALDDGFLPAAPAKDACRYCDFRPVCGPYEETRTKLKEKGRTAPLVALRRAP